MKILFFLIVLCIKNTSLFSQGKTNNLTDSSGLKQNTRITYYKNGKVKVLANYKNDTLNGKYKSFFSNGKIEFEANYIMGIKCGVSLYYNKNGSLKAKSIAKNDKSDLFIQYKNGKVEYKEVYKNDTLIELWINGKMVINKLTP